MSYQRNFKELQLNKLFADIDESVITSIYKPENFKEVNEGTIIYRAGDRSNELFLLLRGDVKIKFPSHNYISRRLFNDFFGEKELYDHTRRNSSAVANSKCLLYTIPIHIFETLISKSETIKKNIETLGELKIPEVSSTGKSRIDLTKSVKPRLFKAIYSRDRAKEGDEPEDKALNVLEQLPEKNNVDLQIDDASVELDNEIIIEEGEVETTPTFENENEMFEEVRSLLKEKEPETEEQIESFDIQDILEVIKSINQPIKLYDTIRSIVKNLQRISDSEAGEIFLIDKRTTSLSKLVVQRGTVTKIAYSSTEGLTRTCALQRNIINLEDPHKDKRFNPNIDQPANSELNYIIYLPLLGHDQDMVGVLQLARNNQVYSEKDIEKLKLITKHAAFAIEKCKSINNFIEMKKQDLNDNVEKFLSDNLLIPIKVINSYTLLLNQEAISQKVKDMIGLIKNQTNFTWDIIQSVYNYNKNEFTLNPKRVNINEFMNSITELLSDYCGLRNINLLRKIGDDTDVSIDSGKLFMAIFQLIENACNVTQENGNVFISSRTHQKFVQINVRDEGPGIPVELIESIFTPGYSDSKKRSRFGLQIAKRIVELHFGHISFSKNSDTGTTFTIRIPIV